MGRFFASRGDSSTFYALFNGQSGDGLYAIGAATRTSGTWAEYALNPVLQKGSSGTWDDGHVKDPWLLWDGSQYVMYYSGYDGTDYRIGRATAPSHEGPWTKDASNPLIDLGSSGDFDDDVVIFPTVLYEPSDTGAEWKMWYTGRKVSDGKWRIGYASSTDGISWTKFGQVVSVGAGGAWDDEGAVAAAIYKEAGTYYLYYGGTSDPGGDFFWQGGLVTFTDPEGTYTKDAGNPVMLARFNDANTSQAFDANPTPGTATVDIPTPGAFTLGEPVIIADGDTTAESYYLTAIGGSTVTLDRNITGTFTGGGRLRSFAINSVQPRAILARSSGGYEAFVSIYQPVADLTQPASKLWEGSIEMRAAALDDTWTYYYVAGRGLLFPLEIGAAWHTRSAENPSVIAAP